MEAFLLLNTWPKNIKIKQFKNITLKTLHPLHPRHVFHIIIVIIIVNCITFVFIVGSEHQIKVQLANRDCFLIVASTMSSHGNEYGTLSVKFPALFDCVLVC